MIKTFTNQQLFCVTDGRLFDSIDDVYNILNHVCDCELMTHHLPVAFAYLKEKNPDWLELAQFDLWTVKGYSIEKADFPTTKAAIQGHMIKYSIPQLKDSFDTSDFGKYMVDNSLLIKK